MKKVVAVSFEGEDVRVVYAITRGSGVEVTDVVLVKDEDFDRFLEKEKTKEFVVVHDFKEFYQDIISVPPVKNKYVKKIIEDEIKRRAPEFHDGPFISLVSGESIVENRKVKDVFVFAVKRGEVSEVTERFARCGKKIRALYPNIFTVAHLVASGEEPFLCVLETSANKTLFLLNGGKMEFVRTAQSPERGMNDRDMQNIFMTLNYCRQVVRVNPAFILLAGTISRCDSVSTELSSLPIACLRMPLPRSSVGDSLVDYLCPLSALSIEGDKTICVLTPDYERAMALESFLKYATLFFLSLSLLGMGYIGVMGKNILELKKRLASVRENLPDVEGTIALYDEKRADLSVYDPFVASLESAAARPDVALLLYDMSRLTSDSVRIDSLSIALEGGRATVDLKGVVRASGYTDRQRAYQNFVDSLARLDRFQMRDHSLDLTDGSWTVMADYQ